MLDILFWIGAICFLKIVYELANIDDYQEIHHDSRPGSFYEISNRRDK